MSAIIFLTWSSVIFSLNGGILSLLAKNNVASSQTMPNPTFNSFAGSGITLTGTGSGTSTGTDPLLAMLSGSGSTSSSTASDPYSQISSLLAGIS